jgi:phosphoglycerol transferase
MGIKKFLKMLLPYIGAITCSFFILVWVLRLWDADLSVPFIYDSDGLPNLVLVKGMINNGWYLHNSYVGMPSGLDYHDFPFSENFHLLLIKLISLFCPDHSTTMNIFYLLVFPLTTATSFFVFRHFKFSSATSFLGSILFTFLPYHLLRGEGHIFLSSYYAVPLMVMVILLIFENGAILFKPDSKSDGKLKLNLLAPKFIMSIFVCILTGSTGIYYAFFGSFFLLIAGLSASISRKRFYPLLVSGILVFVISITILISIAPNLWHIYNKGRTEVARRNPADAEIYGLKIIQLILPVDGHRVPFLHKLKNAYNYGPSRPLINENTTSSLGGIGSLGFLVLIGWLLYRNPKSRNSELKINLSILNGAAVFLGTMGGFGALFAFLIPQIRCYNRISVYIAFFSFFAVTLVLEDLMHKRVNLIKKMPLVYPLIFVLAIIGILDQTTEFCASLYQSVKREYSSDADFVRKIESSTPKNAMIFQLPYVPFPESGPVHKMRDYSLFKGYLHSKQLRWSYGAMRGREGDRWQKMVSKLPISELVETASAVGFTGIYIDRFGYGDMGTALEKELMDFLKTDTIISKDGRLFFIKFPDKMHTVELIKKRQAIDGRMGTTEDLFSFDSSKVNAGLRAGSIDVFDVTRNPHPWKESRINKIHTAGWAFDPIAQKPAKSIVILDNGTPLTKVPVHINRKDVASTLGNSDLLVTGWAVILPGEKLGKGKHRLEFFAELLDGTFAPLQNNKGAIHIDVEN